MFFVLYMYEMNESETPVVMKFEDRFFLNFISSTKFMNIIIVKIFQKQKVILYTTQCLSEGVAGNVEFI